MGDDIAYPQIPEEKASTPDQLSVSEKVEFLRGVEMFSQVAVEELFQLAALAREVEFPSGTQILAEGRSPEALLLIVRGKVELQASEHAARTAGPGEALALHSMLTHEAVDFTATAMENTLVLSIPAEDFLHLISQNAEILVGLFKFFARALAGVSPPERAAR